MKIAISATGKDLNSEVDPRFGRCQYFILVDPDTMQFEAIENSNTMASGGAGIASAQLIADKGVEAVLTGNCGPNAYEVLAAAGVKVVTGAAGKVQDAIKAQIPLGRLGQPEDVAAAVAFLVSQGGDYFTGQTLHVNGGMYMGN